jgi:hypothetical protein
MGNRKTEKHVNEVRMESSGEKAPKLQNHMIATSMERLYYKARHDIVPNPQAYKSGPRYHDKRESGLKSTKSKEYCHRGCRLLGLALPCGVSGQVFSLYKQ